MYLTQQQFDMLTANGSFFGIDISPKQEADGRYCIRLIESDWVIFQRNQGNVNSAGGTPGTPADTPGAVQLSVTRDSSA